MTEWAAVAAVWLDRHRELEAELVREQLGSIQGLAAVRLGEDR